MSHEVASDELGEPVLADGSNLIYVPIREGSTASSEPESKRARLESAEVAEAPAPVSALPPIPEEPEEPPAPPPVPEEVPSLPPVLLETGSAPSSSAGAPQVSSLTPSVAKSPFP